MNLREEFVSSVAANVSISDSLNTIMNMSSLKRVYNLGLFVFEKVLSSTFDMYISANSTPNGDPIETPFICLNTSPLCE